MSVELYPSFFNDVFGPVMLAGSSSHLAAPQRLGLLTNYLTGGKNLKKIEVLMDKDGSFAGTFGLMSEDIGMCAGALGLTVDSPKRNQCHDIAKKSDIEVVFTKGEMKESDHLNSMKYILTTEDDEEYTLVGDSIAGGMVQTKVIQGFPYTYKGDIKLLMLAKDNQEPTKLDAVKELLTNILRCDISRNENGVAYFFQAEEMPSKAEIEALVPDCKVYMLDCILPTATSVDRKPQLFKNATEWRKICEETGKPMHEVAIDYEMAASGLTREAIIERFRELSRLMIRQVECMDNEDFGDYYHCYGFDINNHKRLAEWQKDDSHLPNVVRNAVRHYFSVLSMAPGVLNVPGPHGAGGGVTMSSLRAAQLEYGFDEDKLIEGLLVAAGFGAIAYSICDPTGETIGCAGEQGLSLVFASVALTHILGGSPADVESAASQAMQVSIGWPCDPVLGAEGEPCLSRGMTAVTLPFVFAELARAGHLSPFPFHEMLGVVVDVAKRFDDDLLCTGRGGCAACPTACAIKTEVGM